MESDAGIHHMKNMKLKSFITTTLVLNSITVGILHAQEQPDDLAIEKITVTAQRKAESMQSTPVSISAINADFIEKMNIDNAKDLSQVMPNVLFKPVSGGSAGITPYIRGGGVTDGAMITSEAEVGIYIDDVYQPRSASSFIESLDLERIEVLRGPQGTLYGRNSSAGALKIISRVPDEMFRFKNEAGVGRWNEIYDKFVVSGALTDDEKLRGGITGMIRDRDGGRQYNATQDKDVGEESYKGFQTDLYYEGDTFTARWKNYFTDYDSDGIYASALNPFEMDNKFDEIPFTSGKIDTVLSPYESYTQDKQYGSSLHLSTQLTQDIELLSITSWSKLTNDWATGFSGGVAYSALAIDIPGYVELFKRESVSDQSSFSQELQLQGNAFDDMVSYIFGLYYFKEWGNQYIESEIFFAPSTINFDISTKSYAVFTQANIKISDDLDLIVGGRYTEDKKHLDALVGTDPVSRDDTFNKFTPKLALNYQATDDLLLYTSYTEGFKAGGYNGLASTAQAVNSPFDMQEMAAYEVGVKSEWWNNRLRVNLSGFFNDYTNLQQQSLDNNGAFITENYDAEHKGIEIEVSARLTSDISVWANGVSQDSGYTGSSATGGNATGAFLDNKMTNVFDYQYALGIDYVKDIGPGTLSLGTNLNRRDEFYSTADNFEIGHVAAVTLIDAYASYSVDRWKVSLSGKNLTNEKFWYTGFGFSLIQPRLMSDPMTWRLSISYEM